MSILTTLMGLGKAENGDNARTYLAVTLFGALDVLDAHTHASGAGAAVKRIQNGVAVDRPAAAAGGSVYFATDTGIASFDTGAAWVDLIKSVSAVLTTPTLHQPVINGSVGLLTLPAGADTLVGRATTDTLTNKTLTLAVLNSPTLTTPVIAATGWTNAVHAHAAANSGGALATGAIVGTTDTQTLTNKTLTSPVLTAATHTTGNLTVDNDVIVKSGSSNPADAGAIRLPNTEVVNWRNAANSANLSLGADGSNRFNLDGAWSTSNGVGSSGGASATPAAPTKYLAVMHNGTEYRVPLYAI